MSVTPPSVSPISSDDDDDIDANNDDDDTDSDAKNDNDDIDADNDGDDIDADDIDAASNVDLVTNVDVYPESKCHFDMSLSSSAFTLKFSREANLMAEDQCQILCHYSVV